MHNKNISYVTFLKILVPVIIVLIAIISVFVYQSTNTNISGNEHLQYDDDIYMKLTYGGGGDTDIYCYSSDLIIHNDGSVEMYFMDELSGTTTIDNFSSVSASINRDKLYRHNVTLSDGCDGRIDYIYLYDIDGTEHAFGGYMVSDNLFFEFQNAIYDAIGLDWISSTRNNAIDSYKNMHP